MNKTELLEKFHEIAVSPRAQMDRYLAEGKKVVLAAPVYTPEELVHAMGAVPMGVWGADVELNKAKTYFPAFICSIVQSIVELGMNGDYKGASAIMVPHLCDSLKAMGQNFHCAVPEIPFIPVCYPQNRKPEYGLEFTISAYERVVRDLAAATGLTLKPDALAASIAVYNEHNAVMRELSAALAIHGEITACQRSDIFKSAFFIRKEEHTALVRQLLKALQAEPAERTDKIPVMISGILADSPKFNKILDENALHIVVDDLANQSRQYRTDAPVTDDPMRDLAVKFQNTDNCSLLYDPKKGRVGYIVDLCKKNRVKGLIIAITKFCDPEEFDYPLIKRACDENKIPNVMVEVDRQMVEYGQVQTTLDAFREVISE